jgi:hypothetical protein
MCHVSGRLTAVTRPRRLLLLDEATSALDAESEVSARASSDSKGVAEDVGGGVPQGPVPPQERASSFATGVHVEACMCEVPNPVALPARQWTPPCRPAPSGCVALINTVQHLVQEALERVASERFEWQPHAVRDCKAQTPGN